MAQKRSPTFIPVLPATSPQRATTIPTLQTKTSDLSSVEDNGRVASLRRQSSSGTSDADSESVTRMRKKAEPVKSACAQCQKRKTKCSGDRPTCRFCTDRGLECSWDIGDGMTRTADLKQKLQDEKGRGDKLKRMLSDEAHRSAATRQKLEASEERQEDLTRLMEAMRSSTDQVSTMLLARLRLGEPIEDLIQSLRSSMTSSHMDVSTSPTRPSLISAANSSGSGSSIRDRASSNSPIVASSSTATTPPMLDYSKYRTDSGQSINSQFSEPKPPSSRSSLSLPAHIDTSTRASTGMADSWTPVNKQGPRVESPISPTRPEVMQDVSMSGMHEDWSASDEYNNWHVDTRMNGRHAQPSRFPSAGFER